MTTTNPTTDTPTAAPTLTKLERKMLVEIVDSGFHCEPGDEVWTWDACELFGRSAGGIMSSLVKKKLVIAYNAGPKKDHTCVITPAGYAALEAGAV